MFTQKKLKTAVVAFVDILGFSNRLRTAKNVEDLADISKAVSTVQAEFDFQSKDPNIKDVHKMYAKKVLAFSDCVVIAIPLKSAMTQHEGTFDPLMSELHSLAMAQAECVQRGLFLRGGIDIGWWFSEKNILVSPALANAYALEKEANVPVLSICEQAFEFFKNHHDNSFYARDPLPSLFKQYSETKSKTERYFLDYIRVCLDSVNWQRNKAQVEEYRAADSDVRDAIAQRGYTDNAIDWLNGHKRQISKAIATVSDASVRAKYEWLIRYHNEFCIGSPVYSGCAI
jgi:hypothetical protein